eukprot:sb/3478380/
MGQCIPSFRLIGAVGASLWASQNAIFGKKRTKTYYCILAHAAGGRGWSVTIGHLCACQRSDSIINCGICFLRVLSCQANALTTVLARSLFERSENRVRPML